MFQGENDIEGGTKLDGHKKRKYQTLFLKKYFMYMEINKYI